MLRAPRSVFPAHAAATRYSAKRGFTTTSVMRQIQNRGSIIEGTHGAGLTQHTSMANARLDPRFHRSLSQASPAADLFRTKVHEGLGTSERDPYVRTLPNQESRAPESTVLTSAATTAASLDEVQTLDKRWGTMQYWIGQPHARLPLYVRHQQVAGALPVSAKADRLLAEFHTTGIQSLTSSPKEREALKELWEKAVRDYGALNALYAFDRDGFTTALARVHRATKEAFLSVCGKEESVLVLEVLRRKAVLKRNAFLAELLPVVENSAYLGHGDAVWRVFFDAVEKKKGGLFSKTENKMVGFAWDALMLEDATRAPSVSAPLALFLTLLAVRLSETMVEEGARLESSYLDEGLRPQASASRVDMICQLVDPVSKRQFVSDAVLAQLRVESGAASLAAALRDVGQHSLSRDASLCEAMNDSQRLAEAEATSLLPRFANAAEVKSVLASILNGTDTQARTHVAKVFGVSTSSPVDWDKAFQDVDWSANTNRLTTELLTDKATLAAFEKLVRNAIGAKGLAKQLFSEETAAQLEAVRRAREERAAAMKAKCDHLAAALSSHQQVDASIRLLESLPVDLTPLDELARTAQKSLRTPRQQIDMNVLEALLTAVARRHPSWVKAGVLAVGTLHADATSGDASQSALEAMVRMYVRLAYVPQAGAAVIAQHTRRRIGPIGTSPHQFNVPAEVGFVEQYDNLQYKRYDWQGWYQRMVDIHNRNVSIRCRLDDLKRLDGTGNPFVDLQTERRLRIVAGDHVGMGVLKLDNDKYEDQADNMTFGSGKLSELLADARKAQLGMEYWPTVEVKVRRPSGQSQAYYSTMDFERIEKKSAELYGRYRDAKKRSLFVTPMDMWLDVKGMQVRKTADKADADGYTVDALLNALNDEKDK